MPEAALRKAFGEGLVHLNQNVVRMAELAQTAVRKAVDGLLHRNESEAREVYEIDHEIYRLQRLVESECTDLIALHAPVARDLRTITTVLKISTDLDRIGRGAKNISDMTLDLVKLDPAKPNKIEKLSRNADLAIHMVEQAVRGFVEQDDRSVRDMGMFDDAVDNLYEEIFSDLVASMKNRSIQIEAGAHYILVNRQIERIADHAVNISNRVTYLVTGEPPLKAPEPPPKTGPAVPPAPGPSSDANPAPAGTERKNEGKGSAGG